MIFAKADISEDYPKGEWFLHCFGFCESVEDVYENIECVEAGDHAIIKSKVNGREFNAGNFQVRNLPSFVSKNFEARHGGSLSILNGSGWRREMINPADILTTQALLENNGATYLAASNFNCLEFCSGRQTAADGITNYVYDPTQGPYCALATAGAVMYRNYFIPRENGKRGQIGDDIKLLGKTPIYVDNGFPFVKEEKDVKKLAEIPFDYSDHDVYYIGVHRNCEVTTTRGTQNGFFADVKTPMIAHHVYAAALNFMRNHVWKNEFTLNIEKHILEAEYRATIYAAWENSLLYPDLPGSKKLFLTLLGGGVHLNPTDLICNAITVNKDLIEESGLEVIVVCFSDFEDTYQYLKSTIEETHGKILEK